MLLCVHLASFCLLVAPASVHAVDYYVDGDSGDDAYDGLSPTDEGDGNGPRRTWAWFHAGGDLLAPGDRVLFRRGSTMRHEDAGIDFRPSNMENVYFGAYGDEALPNPVFDSQGNAAMYIGYNGPTVGLIFEDITFTTSIARPVGAMITAYSSDTEGFAQGIVLRRVEVDATLQDGLEVGDETVTFASNDMTIEDCYIHGASRAGLYVNGQRNTFQRNVIVGFFNGIKLNTDGPRRPRYAVIRRNLLINPTGNCFQLAETDHGDVYSNVCVNTGERSSEAVAAVRLDDDEHGDGEPGAEYMNVFNNTFIFNSDHGDYDGVRTSRAEIVGGMSTVGTGNIVRNNVFYVYNDTANDFFVFQTDDTLLPTMDHNIYFSSGLVRWGTPGTLHDTLGEWQATSTTPDLDSLVADPQFLEQVIGADPRTMNFGTESDSPTVDGGAEITLWRPDLPFEDFYGNARLGAPDIGAVEYQGEACAATADRCEASETCLGGALDDFRCCVGGSCIPSDTADAGPGVDAGIPEAGVGASPDGGPGVVEGGCTIGRAPGGLRFILVFVVVLGLFRLRRGGN